MSLALCRVPDSLLAFVPLSFSPPPRLNYRPLINPPIPYSPLHLSLRPASCSQDTTAPQCSHAPSPASPPPPPPPPPAVVTCCLNSSSLKGATSMYVVFFTSFVLGGGGGGGYWCYIVNYREATLTAFE